MSDKRPSLFVVCGPSGVGKTTIARILADKTTAKILTSEKIIMDFFDGISNAQQDKDFNQLELTFGYKAMLLITKYLLHAGHSVILDGVFRSQAQRNFVQQLADQHNAALHFIMVTCPENIVQERITKRLALGKQPGGFQNHLFLRRIFEPIAGEHYIIDSSLNIEEQLCSILSQLN